MEKYIVVIDSGIGGLSVLKRLQEKMPNENYLYYGDNENAPYGSCSVYRLRSLILDILIKISKYKIKCIVIACNTLSLSVREFVQDFTGIKTFGVFPPVESLLVKGAKCVLFATPLTAGKFQKNNNFISYGIKDLAKDIERKAFSLDKINISDYLDRYTLYKIKKNSFNNIILGCTHYIFIENQIINHFCPQKIVSGNQNTANAIFKYLNFNNLLTKKQKNQINTNENGILFLGNSSEFNYEFYHKVVNRM